MFALGADKTTRTYESGIITGWSTQHYAVTLPNGIPAPLHKKFYDLKGAGMLYQIDDCASFAPGQAVDYRVDGNKIYIRRHCCPAKISGGHSNPLKISMITHGRSRNDLN
jgi:hypothetical protein